jgi:hypothetical protein
MDLSKERAFRVALTWAEQRKAPEHSAKGPHAAGKKNDKEQAEETVDYGWSRPDTAWSPIAQERARRLVEVLQGRGVLVEALLPIHARKFEVLLPSLAAARALEDSCPFPVHSRRRSALIRAVALEGSTYYTIRPQAALALRWVEEAVRAALGPDAHVKAKTVPHTTMPSGHFRVNARRVLKKEELTVPIPEALVKGGSLRLCREGGCWRCGAKGHAALRCSLEGQQARKAKEAQGGIDAEATPKRPDQSRPSSPQTAPSDDTGLGDARLEDSQAMDAESLVPDSSPPHRSPSAMEALLNQSGPSGSSPSPASTVNDMEF